MKIIKRGWRIAYRSFTIRIYCEVRVTFNETCNTGENEIDSATKRITLNAFATKSRFRTSPPSFFFFFFLTRGNISIYQRYIAYTFLNIKIIKLYSDDKISLSWRRYAACKTSERNFPDVFKATTPCGVTKGGRKKESERERGEEGAPKAGRHFTTNQLICKWDPRGRRRNICVWKNEVPPSLFACSSTSVSTLRHPLPALS